MSTAELHKDFLALIEKHSLENFLFLALSGEEGDLKGIFFAKSSDPSYNSVMAETIVSNIIESIVKNHKLPPYAATAALHAMVEVAGEDIEEAAKGAIDPQEVTGMLAAMLSSGGLADA